MTLRRLCRSLLWHGSPAASAVLIAGSGCAVEERSAEPSARPSYTAVSWQEHLDFLTAGGDRWLTSNAQYQTPENGEPDSYALRYRPALGNTWITGCLWGELGGEVVGVFWDFFEAWNPVDSVLTVYQSGRDGTVGAGTVELRDSGYVTLDQTFVSPNGATFRTLHRSIEAPPDTHVTASFDWRDGEWIPRRSYTWVKTPMSGDDPCSALGERGQSVSGG